MPVDIYVGGMEHAIMHLLYARFFNKFMVDMNGEAAKEMPREPFKELIVQGLVMGQTYQSKKTGKYVSKDQFEQML